MSEHEERGNGDEGARFTKEDLDVAFGRGRAAERERFKDYDELKAQVEELSGRVAEGEATAKERDELSQKVEELEGATTSLKLSQALQAEQVRRGAKSRYLDHIVRLLPSEAAAVEDGKVKFNAKLLDDFAREFPDYYAPRSTDDGGARERSGPARQPDMNDAIRAGALSRRQ